MKQIVVCRECRNVYLRRTGEERCPFCVGAPGEVIMELVEEVKEEPVEEVIVEAPGPVIMELIEKAKAPSAAPEEKPRAERRRGKK